MLSLVKRAKNYLGRQNSRVKALLNPQKANQEFCENEARWEKYFKDAEGAIESQWREMVWPNIKEFDFSQILELAPGAGRNTVRLAEYAQEIHAVDFNELALQKIKERVEQLETDCKISIYKNDGATLGMIPNQSVTMIYCWDSAVHFDKKVLESYIKEFGRVLKSKGKGFIHHSNMGDRADIEIKNNKGWRSNASAALVKEYCENSGLKIEQQIELAWAEGVDDCMTIFSKP